MHTVLSASMMWGCCHVQHPRKPELAKQDSTPPASREDRVDKWLVMASSAYVLSTAFMMAVLATDTLQYKVSDHCNEPYQALR